MLHWNCESYKGAKVSSVGEKVADIQIDRLQSWDEDFGEEIGGRRADHNGGAAKAAIRKACC